MIGHDFDAPDCDLCPCDILSEEERKLVLKDPPCCVKCYHCGHWIKSERFAEHSERCSSEGFDRDLHAAEFFPPNVSGE